MAWENRPRGKRYYYRSFREGDKVSKQYCGKGARGTEAAEIDLLCRMSAQESIEAFAAAVDEANAIGTKLDTLGNILDLWLCAELTAHGWEFHQSQWRPTN